MRPSPGSANIVRGSQIESKLPDLPSVQSTRDIPWTVPSTRSFTLASRSDNFRGVNLPDSSVALSLLIPTYGRKDSLFETLEHLDVAAASNLVEVLVIDNAPTPEIELDELLKFGSSSIRLLHEQRGGKYQALNLGISQSRAELIAVLDDDMTVPPGWIDAVVASADCRPEFDIFSGRSYVIWPDATPRPSWSEHPLALGIAFSVLDAGQDRDREMGEGIVGFPSSNQYWFRRRVLQSVPTFPPGWTCEACFASAARALGHRGVFVKEIRCGHRVQPELLDPQTFLRRAHDLGKTLGIISLITARCQGKPAPSRTQSLARRWRAYVGKSRLMATRLASIRMPDETRIPQLARALLAQGKREGHILRNPLGTWPNHPCELTGKQSS